jgi:heat shock protein HslJ
MFRPRHMRVAVAGLALVVAGCGGGASETGTNPRGQTYLSESVSEQGKPRPLVPGSRVSLQFMADGRLLARAGCNMISGPAKVDGGRLVMVDAAVTDMGCAPALMEQDTWLTKLLTAKPAWRLDGTKLRLTSEATEIVLTAEQDLPLTGTTWKVDTIVHGDVASGSTADASLVFDGKKIKLSTGCNTGSAAYTVTGDKMRVSDVATTLKMCPPDLMAPEQAILAVLDGDLTVKIEGTTLQLTQPSGNGIRLRGN